MLSKLDRRPKPEEEKGTRTPFRIALAEKKHREKPSENVKEFIRKFGKNVSNAPVGKQRAFVISSRVVLENCAGKLSWAIKNKPAYWPNDLPFTDPNNKKKNKADLTDIVRFLVDQVKMLFPSMEAKNREPESSLATSRHQDSAEKYRDWTMEDQYKRLKGRLLSSFLKLDGQQKNKLLTTIETWWQSWPVEKAWKLEILISQLKLSEKNPQKAEHIRRELLLFADAETSAQSTLSASVHTPSCEGETQKHPIDVEMCSDENLEENKSDKSEIEQLDCGKCDMWYPTSESIQDDPEQLEDFDLKPDVEEQQISSNSVECLTDKDGNWIDEYVLTQKDLFESGMEISDDAAFKKPFVMDEDEPKTSDVPEVPPNTDYKDIAGVRVYQENFDTLKSDKQPDAVIIAAVLALMQRDYEDVEFLRIVNFKEQRNYKLEMSDWKRQWLLVPVLHDKHWLLLAADNKAKTFCILDSSQNEQLANDLTIWFRDLMFKYTGNWERIDLPCGRQKDANSCGYFLLMNAEAFVNQVRRDITPDLFRRCFIADFRKWIIWKLKHSDISRSTFCHQSLLVAEYIMCPDCQEMHKEVFFVSLKSLSLCTLCGFNSHFSGPSSTTEHLP